MKQINVGTSTPYPIYIERGMLANCGVYIRQSTKAVRAAIITDDNVDKFHSDTLIRSLEESGFTALKFVFPHGEASKCSDTLNAIYDFLCENDITRTDCLIALGGGVVGDITGFAAATYLRGIDYIQVPTSLLAMTDSSVGGKTAIDIRGGKNLVGAFKQPTCVICDPDTLTTLPREFLCDGMGEVVKYGMIADADLFAMLEAHTLDDLTPILPDIIARCVDIKRDVVEEDEFDLGRRLILNYGHTLAHAIEGYYHYTTYTHGCAVAAGMCLMAKRTSDATVYERLCHCVENYDLPTSVTVSVADLLPYCGHDKKRQGDTLRYVTCEQIGKAEIHALPFPEFCALMQSVSD